MKIVHQPPDSFFTEHLEFWAKDEPRRGVFVRFASRDASSCECWAIYSPRGKLALTACLQPGDQLLLSDGCDASLEALAEHFSKEKVDIPRVFAPSDASTAFLEHWQRCSSLHYEVVKKLYHYLLDEPCARPDVACSIRAARSEDTALLVEMMQAVQDEQNTLRPYDAQQAVLSELEAQTIYVCIGPQGVVMAMGSLYPDRYSRGGYIDRVYTRPEFRGVGYARCLVAELVSLSLVDKPLVYLSTDVLNTAANAVYQKLGFKVGCVMHSAQRV